MKRTLLTAFLAMTMTSAFAAETRPTTTTTGTTQMENCGEHMKSLLPLPTKFEELMTSVANNMSAHAAWMNKSTDKNAKAEATIVKKLAADHKAVATQMKTIIKDMETASKMAPAPHDMATADPKGNEAMLNQAKLEREMADLMIKDAEKTEKMVADMKNAHAAK